MSGRLIGTDITQLLDASVFSKKLLNTYRQRICYTRQMGRVLRTYEPSLRVLFTAVCELGGRGEKAKHMGFDEFRSLMRALGVLADGDVSERQLNMCFAWSRMVVLDETSDTGRLKETHLPFEGAPKFSTRTLNPITRHQESMCPWPCTAIPKGV